MTVLLPGLIKVYDKQLPLGADGLCFDKSGNLYIGNFADGTVHRFQLTGRAGDAQRDLRQGAVYEKCRRAGLLMRQQV